MHDAAITERLQNLGGGGVTNGQSTMLHVPRLRLEKPLLN